MCTPLICKYIRLAKALSLFCARRSNGKKKCREVSCRLSALVLIAEHFGESVPFLTKSWYNSCYFWIAKQKSMVMTLIKINVRCFVLKTIEMSNVFLKLIESIRQS